MATETKDKLVTLEDLKTGLDTINLSWSEISGKPIDDFQIARLVSKQDEALPISYVSNNVSLMNGNQVCFCLKPNPSLSDNSIGTYMWLLDYRFTMNVSDLTKPNMSPYGWNVAQVLFSETKELPSYNVMHCLTASFWDNSKKIEYPLTVDVSSFAKGQFNINVRSSTLDTLPSGSVNYVYVRGMIKQR